MDPGSVREMTGVAEYKPRSRDDCRVPFDTSTATMIVVVVDAYRASPSHGLTLSSVKQARRNSDPEVDHIHI